MDFTDKFPAKSGFYWIHCGHIQPAEVIINGYEKYILLIGCGERIINYWDEEILFGEEIVFKD
jgi:hypothetical protein